MCRYIYADQVIGTTFIELLKNNIMEISLEKLFKIERNLDRILRDENDTITCMSIKDVYSVVEDYQTIFEINNKIIKVKESSKKKDLLELLDDYFKAGLPQDISSTIDSKVTELVGVSINGENKGN